MEGEPKLVTLDYSLEGHEFYISVDRQLRIHEVHFRTENPMPPNEYLEFVNRSFAANYEKICQSITELFRPET